MVSFDVIYSTELTTSDPEAITKRKHNSYVYYGMPSLPNGFFLEWGELDAAAVNGHILPFA
jgi:hypothetical protein